MPRATWPTNKKDLAETMKQVLAAGRGYRAPLMVEWYINYWYLQGVREFNILSYRTGQVTIKYTSDDGKPHLRYEDILNQMQTELGKFMRMDLRPRATRKRLALDAAQKASLAQVVLDELVPTYNVDRLKADLGQGLLMYGTMGVHAVTTPTVSAYEAAEIMTVSPWNLLPVPGRPARGAETVGLMHHRWVPLNHLRERRKDFKIPADNYHKDLEVRFIRPGERVIEMHDAQGPSTGSDPAFLNRQKPIPHDGVPGDAPTGEPWVELVEAWLHTPNNRVERYVVMLGKHIVHDARFYETQPEDLPHMPISVIRNGHTDGFWGRSYVGPLVPLNMEAEGMIASLFKNIRELDMNGILAIPTTIGVNKEDLKPTNKPKVIWFEPDLSPAKAGITQFHPSNTGDFPGKVAMMANQLLDRLGRRSPMDMGQPMGRYDSGVTLGVASEAAGVSAIPLGESVNSGLSCVYAALLKNAPNLLGGRDGLYLTSIDDTLAGIAINESTGKIEVQPDQLPDPDDVILSIAEKRPRDTEGRKKEILTLVQMQLMSPTDFWWVNYKEGLGFATGRDATKYVDAVLAAMYRNLVQWNDGTQPGGVVPSAHMDHRIELDVIEAFMQRALFSLASKEVREAFEVRKAFHEAGVGGFPEGIPSPDQLMSAAEAKAAAGQQPWGAAGPNGPLPPQMGGGGR